MSKKLKHEILGRLVDQHDALEVMRCQTVALRNYLRMVKDGVLEEGKTKGLVAVELYIANDKAIKCLLSILGIPESEMKA